MMPLSMKSSAEFLLALVSICVVLQYIDAGKTPHWLKNCPQKGPIPLDDCILKRIKVALPFVLKGYPKYRIPQLEPLKISSLSVGTSDKQVGLSLKMANTEIWGLKTTSFHTSKLNIPNRSWELQWSSPRIVVLGDYNMDGKILILPIKGDGPGNITLQDVDVTFKMSWEYYSKKGKDYAKLTATSLDFKPGHAFFHLRNLFNGDRHLGAQMNTFLNDNWAEVIREFGPAVGDAFNLVFRQLIQNGFDLAPFDLLFPPK